MFFFFVGGVRQEVAQILQRDVAQCLRCGSPASIVKYNNVLEVFFIPIWRWPGKNPALHCGNCSFMMPTGHFEATRKPKRGSIEQINGSGQASPEHPLRCWSCSRLIEPSFKFCPDCGARQGEA